MFWHIPLYLKSCRVKPCPDFSFHLYAQSRQTALTQRSTVAALPQDSCLTRKG